MPDAEPIGGGGVTAEPVGTGGSGDGSVTPSGPVVVSPNTGNAMAVPSATVAVTFSFDSSDAKELLINNLRSPEYFDSDYIFQGDCYWAVGFDRVDGTRVAHGMVPAGTPPTVGSSNTISFTQYIPITTGGAPNTLLKFPAQNGDYLAFLLFILYSNNNDANFVSMPFDNRARDRWCKVVIPAGTASNETIPGTVSFNTADAGNTLVLTYGGGACCGSEL